jgi:thiamine-phosphate pyrophosphorylase
MRFPVEAYLVTDRRLASEEFLSRLLREAADAGVDRIQIREKDLGGRQLLRLVRQALDCVEGRRTTLFVNDRLDVALSLPVHGLHLGRSSLPPEVARRIAGDELVIGSSAHNLEEALEAQENGADYLFVGPVYPTPSKEAYGDPLGTARLETIVRRVRIPVYAIGGIVPDRLEELRHVPLTGVAMISAFVRARSVPELIRTVHGTRWRTG